MQTSPIGACQIEAFNRAVSEMKLAMSKAGSAWYRAANIDPNNPPAWVESAIKQHALFYAVESCQGRALAGLGQRVNPLDSKIELGRRVLVQVRRIVQENGGAVPPGAGRLTPVDPQGFGYGAAVELIRLDTSQTKGQMLASADAGVEQIERWVRSSPRVLPKSLPALQGVRRLVAEYRARG